jgi:multiple sugar transport system ATP-binding protein
MADIRIERVAKSFGNVHALHEITLAIADGEFVALLGPSGCGKTTLLRIVAGLETRDSGQVVIGGQDVSDLPARRRGLAMVFQNYAVFPHMTVFDNIAFGLTTQGAGAERVRQQVGRAAELLRITPFLDRYPARLSGGQRQRVAVARALAVQPRVLLMDEPLSNLDAVLRLEMRAELKAVLREAGTTTLYVTHDQTEAMGLADRIALMNNGRIEQVDTPTTVYREPSTRFVGSFVGSPPMNFLTLPIAGGEARLGRMSLAAPIAEGSLLLGIRAEDLAIADGQSGFPFEVAVAEPLGSHTLLTGHYEQQQIRVVAPADAAVAPGARIDLVPTASRVVWMDPVSGQAVGGEIALAKSPTARSG